MHGAFAVVFRQSHRMIFHNLTGVFGMVCLLYTSVGAYDIAGTVLAKGCTAVFCYNDLMAYGLYKKYHELGIRIPKDISIIGFNDLYYSRCFEVPLTSVNVQGDRLGFSASERIFSELENPNQDKQVILLEPEISLRKSTKTLSGQV